jgi:hypothetical protein
MLIYNELEMIVINMDSIKFFRVEECSVCFYFEFPSEDCITFDYETEEEAQCIFEKIIGNFSKTDKKIFRVEY